MKKIVLTVCLVAFISGGFAGAFAMQKYQSNAIISLLATERFVGYEMLLQFYLNGASDVMRTLRAYGYASSPDDAVWCHFKNAERAFDAVTNMDLETAENVVRFEESRDRLSCAMGRLIAATEGDERLQDDSEYQSLVSSVKYNERLLEIRARRYNETVRELNAVHPSGKPLFAEGPRMCSLD